MFRILLKKDFSPCSLPRPKHTPRIQLQDCVHFFPLKTHHTNRIKQIKKIITQCKSIERQRKRRRGKKKLGTCTHSVQHAIE